MSNQWEHKTAHTQADVQTLRSIVANTSRLGFLDDSALEVRSRDLPHWRQAAKTYFVTFRLADSLPDHEARRLRTARQRWDHDHPAPRTAEQQRERYVLFSAALEKRLDLGFGECCLRHREAHEVIREKVLGLLSHDVSVHAWVTMPNHLHILLTPEAEDLSTVLRRFKGTTSRSINQILGRTGNLWQKESFDHIVRSHASFQRFRDYIFANPSRLEDGTFEVGMEVNRDR